MGSHAFGAISRDKSARAVRFLCPRPSISHTLPSLEWKRFPQFFREILASDVLLPSLVDATLHKDIQLTYSGQHLQHLLTRAELYLAMESCCAL